MIKGKLLTLGLAVAGTLALAPQTAASAVPATRPAEHSSDYFLIGAQYWDIDFNGEILLTYLNHRCTETTNDVDYAISWLGDKWNDQISSVKTFNNCNERLWENRDFRGADTGWISISSDLRTLNFNDKASSIEFS